MSLRVAFLVKRSAYTAFKEQKGGRLKALVARKDPTVARIASSHEAHQRTVEDVHRAFDSLGVVASEIGPSTKNITSARFALVVTVGGDGTLLRASHVVADVPILGINSAPQSSVGFFCGAKGGGAELLPAIERALDGRLKAQVLSRMQVELEGKLVSRRVLNDALVCHTSPAATSRYLIETQGIAEEHKSSGFWIGPAAGSTAAQRSAGGRVLPLTSELLQLVVREPYTPQGERYRLLRILAKPGQDIVVRSKMREAAMFLDGPDESVAVRYGDKIRFCRSAESLTVLGLGKR